MPDPFPSETLREIADRARVALGADQALVLPLSGGDPLPPGPEGGPSLSAPIRIDGDPVATLIVSRDPGGAPFGEESALLSTVCELAAHAIAASRRADLRTEQLTLVQAVASAVGAATSVDEAFRMAASAVFDHTRYSGVTATMVDRAAREQVVVVDLGGDVATTQTIRRPIDAGLVGACIAEGTQIILSDAPSDERYSWTADGRWESLLLTPVEVEGRCEGVLELADVAPGRFDAADAALMQAVADQVATALVGVRLRERSESLQHESQRRAQRLELAADLSREIAATGSVDELLRTVTVTLHRHTDYTAVWTAGADHRHGTQRMWTITRGRDTVAVSTHPLDSGVIGRVVRTGNQALLGRSHLADAGGAWAAAGYESLIATPVIVGRRCEAVIGLSDLRADQFDESDALLMRTLAEQVAAALRGAALREESDRRATRLNVLAEVARALRDPETIDQALHDAAQAISRYTGYSGLTAWVVEPARGERRAVFARDRGTDIYVGLRVPTAAGIPGAAITSGKVLRLGRVGDHPAFSWPGRDPNNSVLIAPVMVDGACAAALVIADEHPNWFDTDDEELVKAISDHLAAAIRAVRLREESARQAHRLSLAAEIAALLPAEDTPESAIRVAAEAVHDRGRYDAVMAITVLEETEEQLVVADFGASRDSFTGLRRPIGAGITARTIGSGRQNLINGHEHDPDYAPWGDEESFDSLLSTPVMLDGRCVAVIEVASRPMNQFDHSDEALMAAVAEQLAAALRGVRLRSESERRSQRLALTAAVASAVAEADGVDGVLRAAADAIFGPTDYGAVTAVLRVPETGEYTVVTDRVRVGESTEGARLPVTAGAAGRALTTGAQIVVGHLDGGAPPLAYQSALVTPVCEGPTAAAVALYDHRRDRFDAADATLMRTVAEQLIATLRAVRLRDESEQRSSRLALTTEVAGAIASAQTIDEVLAAVVETVYLGRGYSAAVAIRVLPEEGEQVVVANLGDEGTTAAGLHRRVDAGTVGTVIASGEQVMLGDAQAHPAYDWPAPIPLPSELLTPVIVDGECIAVIGVYDGHRDRFDPADALAMRTVADQVAATCRGVLLREQSEQRAERLAALERRHRELMERLVRAQEQERSRVAADLHDDTIQVMSACVISLDSVRLAMQDGKVERARRGLEQVSNLISGAVERTRRMTFDLRPAVLWHHGLVVALEQALHTLESETGIATSLEVVGLERRIDSTMETLVFRSITEILANARVHSGAKALRVRIERGAGVLHVRVADDGRGFDLDAALARARRTNHLGLESLMERVDAAGGRVQITTAPGQGTVVEITQPLWPGD
ncbi:MAG TPA: GAF domain-containing protein [Gaiellales bacterium]|jgi:GAF domain-containing protein|nr:GAF domain-containing protein [Gaiellales bacterium]